MHGFRVVLSDSLRLQKKEIQAGKENVEPNEMEVTTQSSAAVPKLIYHHASWKLKPRCRKPPQQDLEEI